MKKHTQVKVFAVLICGVVAVNPLAAQEGGFADDLIIDPSTNTERYEPLNDVDGVQATALHSNGVLTLTAEATIDSENRNRLFVQNPTDYLESTFSISSASELGDVGRVQGQMRTRLYNVLADGGVDGRTGDVEAFMSAELRADGGAFIEYCLVRRDDRDGGNEVGLLLDDLICQSLPLRVEFDVPIRAAIDFDREAGTVTYRANEFAATVSLDRPFFAPSSPSTEVAASPRDLATAVLDIDEIRTSRSALTGSEANSGVTVPTPFPPIQTEPTAVDSSIAFPFDQTTPVDFIDDFSQPTAQLVFDRNQDNTEAGIAFVDGSLQIEAAQTDPDDCCGNGRLRIQEDTDFIAARVSLLSSSQLPVDNDTRVLVRIEGTWYNDTQDGGFDDRGGDVYLQLRIRVRGDGRRDASFCFDRQNGNGDSEDLNIFEGDNCGTFSTIPDFDTQYNISATLDRSAATMTLTFDSETLVVDLGGPVFDAQRTEKAITMQHEGSSGRVVGRLHSLITESGTIELAADQLLLGPYRPTFSTQYADRDITLVDERLRIEVDSALSEDNQPRFVTRNPSDFVAATVEISSESRLDEGVVIIGVGGHMYNDIADGGLGIDNGEGAVFGIVNLVADADEDSNYFEYCAFRSNDSDFNDSTELLGTDGETCPRFSSTATLDTPVRVAVSIDQSRGVLIFTAGDETIEHSITTDSFIPNNYFNGIRAIARGGSRLIGFADDLAFAADPIPLAESAAAVGFVGGSSGESDAESESSGSSGGGGFNPVLLALFMFINLNGGLIRKKLLSYC